MTADKSSEARNASLDETLLESAHVARDFALQYCPQALGGDCTWYHSVWVYLRALGLVKNAGGQGEFLREKLQSLSESAHARRVLISGSADDAIVHVALTAFRNANRPLELTLVDCCETPLALSRWSAGRAGFVLSTHRADIVEFDGDSSFDVIIANSFLSYVEPLRRPLLFRRWSSLLTQGGTLLLTNRIRPSATAASVGFGAAEGQSFCAAARREAERHRSKLGIDPSQLQDWVREYTQRMKSFPLKSRDELAKLLDDAGFSSDRIETIRFGGSAEIAGPTASDGAEFVRVTATHL